MKIFLLLMMCLVIGYSIGNLHQIKYQDHIKHKQYEFVKSDISPIITDSTIDQLDRGNRSLINIILYAISQIESDGVDIGEHSDGVSYGRYGVTHIAVDELKRNGLIPMDEVIDLTDPIQNRICATQYLILLSSKHDGWKETIRHWNYNDPEYYNKILTVIERNN